MHLLNRDVNCAGWVIFVASIALGCLGLTTYASAQTAINSLCCLPDQLDARARAEICEAQELLYRGGYYSEGVQQDIRETRDCPREVDGFWGPTTTRALLSAMEDLQTLPERRSSTPDPESELLPPQEDHQESVALDSLPENSQIGAHSNWQLAVGAGLALLILVGLFGYALFRSRVHVRPGEIGIVWKAFSFGGGRNRDGHIAARGEAGHQAGTLGPGVHWGYWPWLYKITRAPMLVVPAGEIGLVFAKDGTSPPEGRVLCDYVDCDNFQDGRRFLSNGGQRGRQARLLRAGEYRINPTLFDVVVRDNRMQDLADSDFRAQRIGPDEIGIVTVFDGQALEDGSIAAPTVPGHDSFQNAQAFIAAGGRRGLQEEVLRSGEYFINPWFATIERVPLTKIAAGTVGVVISHVGDADPDATAQSLTKPGYRGIQEKPLFPGSHPINTKTHAVLRVPISQITLNWSDQEKPPSNYDASLKRLKLTTKDGFEFSLKLTQVLKISEGSAPTLISSLGVGEFDDQYAESGKSPAIVRLVNRVLSETVTSHLVKTVRKCTFMEFEENLAELQIEAAEVIKAELSRYGVEAVSTAFSEFSLPDEIKQRKNRRAITVMEHEEIRDQQQLESRKHDFYMQQSAHETNLLNDQLRRESMKAMSRIGIQERETEAYIQKLEREIIALRDPAAYTQLQLFKTLPEVKLPQVMVAGGGSSQPMNLIDLFYVQHLAVKGEAPANPEAFNTFMNDPGIQEQVRKLVSSEVQEVEDDNELHTRTNLVQ